MKKLFCYSVIALAALAASNKINAQNANTTLSNLTSPTKVNVNLLPNKDKTRNLGSGTKTWQNLYLNGAVYFHNTRFLADQIGTGYSNTAIGDGTLLSDTSGDYNTATGDYALYSNTTGSYNTANGHYSLFFNGSGNYNTATGMFALVYNSSGSYNTASGQSAMYHNRTGYYNTAFGNNALYSTTASQYNTAVGFEAGDSYDNGYNNVFIGANVDVNGVGYFNDIAIGQGTICTGSSQVTMGNSSTVEYRTYANWTNISDGRFKKNIKENVPGLAFIDKLQPITYTLDATGIDNFLHKDLPQNKQIDEKAKSVMSKALADKEKIVYTGFVAQDVEKAAKSLNYDFSGVDAAKNDKDLYGLRYAEFVVPLVKGEQELSKQNDSLKSIVSSLQSQINELKAMMVSGNQSAVSGQQLTVVSSASLEQNIPNPFTNNTTIGYSLPQKITAAQIIITDKSGKTLKAITLPAGRQGISGGGKGNLNVDASTLASGAYQYSLIVDGRLIDTKQMVIAK